MSAAALEDVTPPWLADGLARILPKDVVRVYVSSDTDQPGTKEAATVFALSPSALSCAKLTFDGIGGMRLRAHGTVHSVSLRDVLGVSVTADWSWDAGDQIVPRVLVVITLARNLGDLGSEIALPFAREDYSGSRDASSRAAEAFAEEVRQRLS